MNCSLFSASKGRLLVFEGPDAMGKSTLIRAVARSLACHGVLHEIYSFPGNCPGTLGELVYRLHHDASASGIHTIAPAALQALHIAAHLDAIERMLIPALREGKVVLLDRFWWSTRAYGAVNGVDRQVLDAIIAAERRAWGAWVPEAVVLPLRSVEGTDALRLVDVYRILSEEHRASHPVIVVDTNGTPEEAAQELESKLPSLWVAGSGAVAVVPKAQRRTTRQSGAAFSGASTKTTVAYDSFWRLAAERQRIFLQRLCGAPPPWTEDSILLAHKFTNTYRASDRVSQYLIRNVIYADAYEDQDMFFRIMLFKLFNRIDTWEMLVREFGDITYRSYRYRDYDRVLEAAMCRGQKVYSAAYIMPSAGRTFKVTRKHQGHLLLLEQMVKDELWKRLRDTGSMATAFGLLLNYPSIGSFLAYQYLIDLNYSQLLDYSENDFVAPGPGAIDGISKCFADRGGLSDSELIKVVCDRQVEEFARLNIDFKDLWGRPLHLIDCQNLFCEISKYSRVRHPELAGIAGRTRIKQVFTPSLDLPLPMYPPKWALNDAISSWISANRRPKPSLFPDKVMARVHGRKGESK